MSVESFVAKSGTLASDNQSMQLSNSLLDAVLCPWVVAHGNGIAGMRCLLSFAVYLLAALMAAKYMQASGMLDERSYSGQHAKLPLT